LSTTADTDWRSMLSELPMPACLRAIATISLPFFLSACSPILSGEDATGQAAPRQPLFDLLRDLARPPGAARFDAELRVQPGGTARFRSRVNAAPDYRLVSLGASGVGDEWRIELSPDAEPQSGGFILALFDGQGRFLARSVNGYLAQVARRPANPLLLGVTRGPDTGPAAFNLHIERETGAAVPLPQPQAVLVNFAGGRNVQVRDRPAISFPPFSGALLGGLHTERTDVLKDAILKRLEGYFAPYEVTFTTSDQQAAPEPPYSVIHFGGYDPNSLGIADALDLYNRRADDEAIVYVHSFIQYAPLDLTSYELGCMMGDVAAHELGHLLGLFHTSGAPNLMDNGRSIDAMIRGSGLDLAGLAHEVFPYGWLDAALLLEDGVGLRPGERAASAPLAADTEPALELEALAKPLRRTRSVDARARWCALCADGCRP
jgi:hypothetical protein